jgi:hypothetical protein
MHRPGFESRKLDCNNYSGTIRDHQGKEHYLQTFRSLLRMIAHRPYGPELQQLAHHLNLFLRKAEGTHVQAHRLMVMQMPEASSQEGFSSDLECKFSQHLGCHILSVKKHLEDAAEDDDDALATLMPIFESGVDEIRSLFAMHQEKKKKKKKKTDFENHNDNKCFICPITMSLMVDPVSAPDGHSYERKAIEEWIARSGVGGSWKSPVTGILLRGNIMLHYNRNLKQAISAALESWMSCS